MEKFPLGPVRVIFPTGGGYKGGVWRGMATKRSLVTPKHTHLHASYTTQYHQLPYPTFVTPPLWICAAYPALLNPILVPHLIHTPTFVTSPYPTKGGVRRGYKGGG